MCEYQKKTMSDRASFRKISIFDAVGTVLAHDITEIKRGQFKGAAFRKGHIIKKDDINYLKNLGKEYLFVLDIADDEIHEDDAAYAIANALIGEGVEIQGKPREGKINLIAMTDGLLKIHTDALKEFNMLGEVMCSTLHNNSVVNKGQIVAGTRAIPLVLKKNVIAKAVSIGQNAKNGNFSQKMSGIIEVKQLRKFNAGIVITGNEVFYGRIRDSFAPVLRDKLKVFEGETLDIVYAPDDEAFIEESILKLLNAGADLLIITGGMSVDPDDVTRFAIKRLANDEIIYGSPVLPGAMFLLTYIRKPESMIQNSEFVDTIIGSGSLFQTSISHFMIPVLGIPACGMYHKTTVFDIILPRILAGEIIGRSELAELGHGGLCLNCKECRYPICPFGK